MVGWNAVSALLMMIFGWVYYRQKDNKKHMALICKALATSMALLNAVCGAWVMKEEFYGFVVLGLAFCLAADVLLEIYMTAGAACFGAAHVLFLIALYLRTGPDIMAVTMAVILFTLFWFSFRSYLFGLGRKRFPALVYPALLCLMGGTAFVAGWNGDVRATFSAGGILFVLSDYYLIKRTFEPEKTYRKRVLFFYFTSVYLISMW